MPPNSFIVYPRPRISRRDQLAFKVKSVLKGTEHEGWTIYCDPGYTRANVETTVARHELVTFLHQQIAEQKRVDASISGVLLIEEGSSSLSTPKDVASAVDVQLVLPGDAKKQRKQTKQILLDRGERRSTLSVCGVLMVFQHSSSGSNSRTHLSTVVYLSLLRTSPRLHLIK